LVIAPALAAALIAIVVKATAVPPCVMVISLIFAPSS